MRRRLQLGPPGVGEPPEVAEVTARRYPAVGDHLSETAETAAERAKTTKVASPKGPGVGPGELRKDTSAQAEVRLKREIANFERWIKATGEGAESQQ